METIACLQVSNLEQLLEVKFLTLFLGSSDLRRSDTSKAHSFVESAELSFIQRWHALI